MMTAAPVAPQTQDDPAPGRFPSLGPTLDLSDAAHVLSVLQPCAAIYASAHERRAAAMLLARRAISDLWDEPRLKSLTAGERYGRWPRAFPWSPGARQSWQESPRQPAKNFVVLEHLVPAKAHLAELFTTVDEMTPADLIDHLDRFNVFAVITKTEDSLLSQAGRRSKTPDLLDPWARYRDLPGFPAPAEFGPLPHATDDED